MIKKQPFRGKNSTARPRKILKAATPDEIQGKIEEAVAAGWTMISDIKIGGNRGSYYQVLAEYQTLKEEFK